MQAVRLTFLITSLRDGGIETVLLEYLRSLAKYECYHIKLAIASDLGALEVYRDRIPAQVEVLHLVQSPSLVRVPRLRAKGRVSKGLKLWDQLLLNPIRRYQVQRGIQRLAEETDLFMDFDTCAYSFLKGIAKPKLAWLHFSLEQLMRQNARRTKRIGRMLPAYDRVVCISEAMREEAERLFPQIKDKLAVLYNPKDVSHLQQRAEDLPEDERLRQSYILAVERLEESQKDITTLLRAYALLRTQYHISEQLYIIGKGNSEQELRALAADLGIADSVHFLGFFSNPYPWIKRCRVFVHSAKFEGLPTAMIEALLLARPIVATDCPTGPREILADGTAGVLVPVGDATAMATSIARVLQDMSYAQQLEQAAASASSRFDMRSIMPHFVRLIQQVLERLSP